MKSAEVCGGFSSVGPKMNVYGHSVSSCQAVCAGSGQDFVIPFTFDLYHFTERLWPLREKNSVNL